MIDSTQSRDTHLEQHVERELAEGKGLLWRLRVRIVTLLEISRHNLLTLAWLRIDRFRIGVGLRVAGLVGSGERSRICLTSGSRGS